MEKCKTNKQEIIYLVVVCSGQYDDYFEQRVFGTLDKDRAEKWVKKYNKIIENNQHRIEHYYDDQNWDKLESFWYDKIYYDRPKARIREVQLR